MSGAVILVITVIPILVLIPIDLNFNFILLILTFINDVKRSNFMSKMIILPFDFLSNLATNMSAIRFDNMKGITRLISH